MVADSETGGRAVGVHLSTAQIAAALFTQIYTDCGCGTGRLRNLTARLKRPGGREASRPVTFRAPGCTQTPKRP